jgi:hypothetical protein
MQAKGEAEIQSKLLEAGLTVNVTNNFETKIYNPPLAPELQPRAESKNPPVRYALPRSPAE